MWKIPLVESQTIMEFFFNASKSPIREEQLEESREAHSASDKMKWLSWGVQIAPSSVFWQQLTELTMVGRPTQWLACCKSTPSLRKSAARQTECDIRTVLDRLWLLFHPKLPLHQKSPPQDICKLAHQSAIKLIASQEKE